MKNIFQKSEIQLIDWGMTKEGAQIVTSGNQKEIMKKFFEFFSNNIDESSNSLTKNTISFELTKTKDGWELANEDNEREKIYDACLGGDNVVAYFQDLAG